MAYRDENDLLAGADDPERVYIEEIMPAKLELNRQYLSQIGVLTDLKLIFSTVIAVVRG